MLMNVIVQLMPAEGWEFSVFVPGLPGCMSQGKTVAEALENIREVIPFFLELHIERMAKSPPD